MRSLGVAAKAAFPVFFILRVVAGKPDDLAVTFKRAYVGRFNFRGAEQQKKIGLLSGGERNRVHLAKMLKGGGNLLLLDEPTNDLDVET